MVTKTTYEERREIVNSTESGDVIGPRYGLSAGHVNNLRRHYHQGKLDENLLSIKRDGPKPKPKSRHPLLDAPIKHPESTIIVLNVRKRLSN